MKIKTKENILFYLFIVMALSIIIRNSIQIFNKSTYYNNDQNIKVIGENITMLNEKRAQQDSIILEQEITIKMLERFKKWAQPKIEDYIFNNPDEEPFKNVGAKSEKWKS